MTSNQVQVFCDSYCYFLNQNHLEQQLENFRSAKTVGKGLPKVYPISNIRFLLLFPHSFQKFYKMARLLSFYALLISSSSTKERENQLCSLGVNLLTPPIPSHQQGKEDRCRLTQVQTKEHPNCLKLKSK